MKSLEKSLGVVVPVIAAVMLLACVIVVLTAGSDARWGAFVLAQAVFGLFVVCIMAALRDGYGFRKDALFDFKGRDTNILSIAGALILVPSVIALILGNPVVLRIVFASTTAIFAFKAVYVESHRWRRRQTANRRIESNALS
ncbi:hypothetical protein GCM10009785_30920 [Brooklawnia cerclae]|uniref:Uncharacterized protein n=1 Tax=Brooklawnia cerclae TaxID=349934 RepID=A0ABX0SIP8_9ACTN|nr:hypothetical protein [Brooklawnia cerclae]NIH56617.1 hypothetical protein [Brooklawnia cerclae]